MDVSETLTTMAIVDLQSVHVQIINSLLLITKQQQHSEEGPVQGVALEGVSHSLHGKVE